MTMLRARLSGIRLNPKYIYKLGYLNKMVDAFRVVMDLKLSQWVCSASEAICLKLVNETEEFHPTFTYTGRFII